MIGAQAAHAAPVTLRWTQPAGAASVVAFFVYKGATPSAGTVVYTGLPTPDAQGVYSAVVEISELDLGQAVYVWVTAANAAGQSPASNANLLESTCNPAVDADCDGIPDDGAPGNVPCSTGQTSGCDDNCRFAPNPGQQDRGGINSSSPDGIGDACQCGDVNADGRVSFSDAVMTRYATASPPLVALTNPDLCDVGSSAGCTFADAVILWYATSTPPGASISQVCDPSLP